MIVYMADEPALTAWAEPALNEKSAATTTCEIAAGVALPTKLVSPPYVAVTLCAPGVRLVTASVAWPAVLSGPLPRLTPASSNVTLPVGVPLPGATAATVAVSVTD